MRFGPWTSMKGKQLKEVIMSVTVELFGLKLHFTLGRSDIVDTDEPEFIEPPNHILWSGTEESGLAAAGCHG